MAAISNEPADFRGIQLTEKLSLNIIRVVKREKLTSTIMMNLNKLKMNDSL